MSDAPIVPLDFRLPDPIADSAPRPLPLRQYNLDLALRHWHSGLQYQTGPRRGQQLADLRRTKESK